ncbi:MAG: hypothetical protein ACLSGS_04300 [Adlercreutzia sp.]
MREHYGNDARSARATWLTPGAPASADAGADFVKIGIGGGPSAPRDHIGRARPPRPLKWRGPDFRKTGVMCPSAPTAASCTIITFRLRWPSADFVAGR